MGTAGVLMLVEGLSAFNVMKVKRENEKKDLMKAVSKMVKKRLKVVEKKINLRARMLKKERILCLKSSKHAKLAASNAEYYSALPRKGGKFFFFW